MAEVTQLEIPKRNEQLLILAKGYTAIASLEWMQELELHLSG